MPTDAEIILGQGQVIRILRSMLNTKGVSDHLIDRALAGMAHYEACPRCGGGGRTQVSDGDGYWDEMDCHKCNGEGLVPALIDGSVAGESFGLGPDQPGSLGSPGADLNDGDPYG